jgi:hypothetical protein
MPGYCLPSRPAPQRPVAAKPGGGASNSAPAVDGRAADLVPTTARDAAA